jgi:uncharacterized circularly permuted ATP-grasp superfamily protein
VIHADHPSLEASLAFRKLLEADPKGTREQYEAALQEMRELHLLVGDEVAPFGFAPAIVSTARYGPIKKDVARLIKLLTRLEPMLLRPRWLQKLRVSEAEQDLIRLPAGFELGLFVSRIDGFVVSPTSDSDSGFRLVEVNSDSPGGAAYLDVAGEVLSRTPVWQEFRRNYPGHLPRSGQRILKLLLRAWKLWGGTSKPRVGIVDWITVSTASEFDVLRQQFLAQGIDTVVADPRELEYSKGKLRDYDGKPLDLVYRRVLVEDLVTHGPDARALLDAYRAGAICLVNPFRSKPLTVKSLMAAFHDPEMAEILEPEELAFVRRVVPWTAIVEDGPVLKRVAAQREQLVLKPADSWGGQGVYLGWQMSEQEWQQAMEEAMKSHYIAQKRIPIAEHEFPLATSDGWEYKSLKFDLNPFTFGPTVGTPLVRTANNDLLNIKAGGQLCVTYQLGLGAV